MKPKTFTEAVMRNTCRYISGDPKEGTDTYCGESRLPGSAYCPEHDRLCHTSARKPLMDMAGMKKAVRA